MKLFITGINGFVGSTLANYFCKKGYIVSGLGRQEKLNPIIDPRCSYFQNDITDRLSSFDAEVVIHTAALGSDTASYDELFLNNVVGTENVLNASKGANQFIYISSSSVYNYGNRPMVEKEGGEHFKCLSYYGQTKFIAEGKVLNVSAIRHKTIFRPHAIYGVNDRLILPRLINLVKGRRLILPSHTTSEASLTNVDNLVRAVELSINNTERGEIYNICDDVIYDIKEVITELLSQVTGKKLKVVSIPMFFWEGFIALNEKLHLTKEISKFGSDVITKPNLIDVSHAQAKLGFIALKNAKQTFVEIGKWYKEQRNDLK